MKGTTAIAAVLAVTLLAGSWLVGQDAPAKVKGQLPPNWGKLGLSDTQKQRVYKVRAEYRPKIEALRTKIEALQEQEREDMQKVLTADQKVQLRKILASRAGKDADEDKKPKKGPDKDK